MKNPLVNLLLGIFLGAAIISVIFWVALPQRGKPIHLNPAPTALATPTSAPMVVQISGEVLHPGVYALPAGSRLFDLIEISGGMTEKSDSKQVNQAAVLMDGGAYYIPAQGEVLPVSQNAQMSSLSASIVNINTANLEELMSLPGIGETKALNIIAHREAHGNFKTIEEIMNVSGIGETIFDSIKGLITVN